MAINDIINESWQGHGHGEVEDALKQVLAQLLDAVERIPQGGISIDELSDSLKALINNAVPNTRKVNNKALNSDITLGAADVGALPADTVIPEGVTVDSAMSSTSENAVQNKVVKAYVDAVSARIDTLIGSGNVQGAIDTFNEVTAFLAGISSSDTLAAKLAQIQQSIPDVSGFVTETEMESAIDDAVDGKQDTLTFDNAPTAGSNNPVKSSGIKTYVDAKATITGITTSQDGAFTITLSDGNSYTVNLTHSHPLYLKHQLLADEAAYNALATKDSGTLYLIPES